MPVIPATQEAEAGESLEPGSRGCSELRSYHCTPAWAAIVKLCLKKNKKGGGEGGLRKRPHDTYSQLLQDSEILLDDFDYNRMVNVTCVYSHAGDKESISIRVCSLNSCLLRRYNSTEGQKAEEETEASFRTRVEVYLKALGQAGRGGSSL